MGYIEVAVESNPDTLTQEALEALVAGVPGFVPKEAHLEVWLLEVISRMTAETRYLFNLVPDSIFKYFGQSLVNVPPVAGAPAEALTTWTLVNSAGYTISAGTLVAFRIAGDELVAFRVASDHVVAPGSSSAVGVLIQAIDVGTYANGLSSGLELVDSLSFVSSVVATTTTANGVDPEEDASYLSRLRDEMTLLTPRFVLAADAAVIARRISGVHRALGIDNYDPGTLTYGNEKTMTLAVVGADGLALSAPIKAQVEAYLESLRELNFNLFVVDPNYTTINVVFTVIANPGYDLTDLDTRTTQAVTDYLSPASWAGGTLDPPVWKSGTNVVRYLEVAEVLNRVEGVDYVSALTLNGSSANVNLTGVALLTQVGTITGTALSA